MIPPLYVCQFAATTTLTGPMVAMAVSNAVAEFFVNLVNPEFLTTVLNGLGLQVSSFPVYGYVEARAMPWWVV